MYAQRVHISMLMNKGHIIWNFTDLEIQHDTLYLEKSMKILSSEEKVLRRKIIPLVKVLWDKHKVQEYVWETEEDMRKGYPYLFEL